MGLWDKLKGELVDIIEWPEDDRSTLAWRFDRYGNEIKNGAQLIVREGQAAVFINEGKLADVFLPGRHELTTRNLPLLSTLMGWKHGFESPFKADITFVNTKQILDQKWGTKNPIMLRCPEFGPVRLRSFGTYALKVNDPTKFIVDIVGTGGDFDNNDINSQLRNIIVSRFSDKIGELKIPVLDMASNYDELAEFIHEKINPEFNELGIELTKFLVENIALPPNVEDALDKRTSMGIIGNLNEYTKFQAAEAMEAAAANPGGGASDGMGLGMGFAMANQMASSMNPQTQQAAPAAAPPPHPGSAPVSNLQFHMAIDGQNYGPYDVATLKQYSTEGRFKGDTMVWRDGMAAWLPAAQVPELGSLFGPSNPPPLPGAGSPPPPIH